MSSLQKNVLKHNLPRMGLPPSGASLSGRSGRSAGRGRQRDFTPLHWSNYFDQSKDIIVNEENDAFRVYFKGNEGPLIVFLHGGGFSGLTWALLSVHLHEIVHCQIMAIDLRGHGSSKTSQSNNLDIETLARDVVAVVNAAFGDDIPPIVLVGHSMGGAIAVQTTLLEELPIMGLVVIDVVEGSAMEALASMQSFLRSRPKSFGSVSSAIEWSLKSGQVRNLESARVSMPGQLKNSETDLCASDEVGSLALNPGPTNEIPQGEVIREEDEDQAEFKQPVLQVVQTASSAYVWRIDLTQTEKFWQGWFEKLSSKFLGAKAAKLLLLAGIDRLDRDLTVGQMQGKFQMQVLPECGHAVHEDVPDKVAEVLGTFLLRNKLSTAKGEFQRVFPAC
nr:EOG090X07NZ [Eulimnadia texana]